MQFLRRRGDVSRNEDTQRDRIFLLNFKNESCYVVMLVWPSVGQCESIVAQWWPIPVASGASLAPVCLEDVHSSMGMDWGIRQFTGWA